jgi:hypothetical protein
MREIIYNGGFHLSKISVSSLEHIFILDLITTRRINRNIIL